MTFVSSTAGLIPGFMSLGVAGHSAGLAMNMWDPKKMKNFNSGKSTKKLIGGFVTPMVGIPMIGVVSGQVAAL